MEQVEHPNEQFITNEQQYVNEMQELLSTLERPLIDILDDARKVLQPLSDVIAISVDFIEELKRETDIGKPLLWLVKKLPIYGSYTVAFQSVIQPLFVKKKEIKDLLTSRDLTVPNVLRQLGAPISRPAKIRSRIVNKKNSDSGEDSEIENSNRKAFLAAVDHHVRILFDSSIPFAGQEVVSRMPIPSRPKSKCLIQAGDLIKEYARGKHSRYFYLFSDRLVHFKSTSEGLTHSGLKREKNVLNLTDVISVDKSPNTSHRKNIIKIKSKGRSDMLLMADTPEEQEHWVSKIQTAATKCSSSHQLYGFSQLFETPFLDLDQQTDAHSTRTDTHTHQLSMELPDTADMYSDPYPDPDDELRPTSPLQERL